jgi:hypothetical protein
MMTRDSASGAARGLNECRIAGKPSSACERQHGGGRTPASGLHGGLSLGRRQMAEFASIACLARAGWAPAPTATKSPREAGLWMAERRSG